jgi:SAM-dependent methyltransferase
MESDMDRKTHWQAVYAGKPDDELSWYQADPQPSLDLILAASGGRGRVIDVGGGSSILVDRLLEARFEKVAVLDISVAAIERSKSRLGERAGQVQWIVADVTHYGDLGQFDVWHDRAAFHFLTDPAERKRYGRLVRKTLPVGGHLIVGTFAADGPEKCSGLEVCRYDARSLAEELGAGFELLRKLTETHVTPWGKPQAFLYCVFRRSESAGILR